MLMQTHYAFDSKRFLAPREGAEEGYAAFLKNVLHSPDGMIFVADHDNEIGPDNRPDRILATAKDLFGQYGIDAVTIAEIADKAGVAGSTVYAVFKSKEGILRDLMEQSLFGDRFQSAQQGLAAIKDPVEAIARTAHVARAIYESESSDLGLLRNVSGFSPALRKIEEEFERTRFEMQEDRLRRLPCR